MAPICSRTARRGALILGLLAAALLAAASGRLCGLLANTGLLTCGTLAVSLPAGAVLGLVLAKVDVPGRRLLAWLLLGMIFVPLYVQATAWHAVLGTGGWLAEAIGREPYAEPWLAGWRGAIWIHAMAAVPWVAMFTAASLAAVERRLEEESLLDAPAWRVLWNVSLRRGSAGVFMAAVWITIVCATEITVTDLFQIRTFAEEIYTDANLGSLSAEPDGFVRSDLALGVAILSLLVGASLCLALPWLPAAAAADVERAWRWRPAHGRWVIVAASWMIAAIVVLPPLVGLAWKAGIHVTQQGNNYERTWSAAKAAAMVTQSPLEHRREWGWSLAIGSAAAASAVAVGLALAWLACMRWWAGGLLAAATAVALAIPAPLMAVWIIGALNRPASSPLWYLTWLYDHTVLAPALAQAARAAPIVGLWYWSQLATVPRDLLEAARSEGAGRFTQLWRIAIPLRLPAILAGAAAALAIALAELSATFLVVPPGVTTISVRIFQLLHTGVDDRLAALALTIFGVAALAIAVFAVAARRVRHNVPEPPVG